MPVSKRVRFEIFKRDDFTCQYCGNKPPKTVLEVDHVLAKSKKGTDDLLNLITSCFDCNRGKSNIDLKEIPIASSKMLEIEKERLEQVKELSKFLAKQRKLEVNQIQQIGKYWFNCFSDTEDEFVFGKKRVPSIKQFLAHLDISEIYDSIDIAFRKHFPKNGNDYNAWLYFCGVCWRKIKGDSKYAK